MVPGTTPLPDPLAVAVWPCPFELAFHLVSSARGGFGPPPALGDQRITPGGGSSALLITYPPLAGDNSTVSCLNGSLPLAECTCVFRSRWQPSAYCLKASSFIGGRPAARRCPKLPKTCVLGVWMRSVDDWPLAKILIQISGGKPRLVAVLPFGGGCDRAVVSSF